MTTPPRPDDAIAPLVAAAARIRFEDIPERVIAFQKKRLLDNLATCLAGRTSAGCREALALFTAIGGARQARVLGNGDYLPVAAAAMQNSIMARALDFCDAIPPGYHPSSTDIPAALAVAEWRGCSGRDVLAALAVGQDFAQRINRACQANGTFYNGFDSNVLAPLAAAVIAGRLIGLDEARLRHAVGLAFNAGAGSFQAYQDKALAVRLAQGQATRNGIEAALFAEAGFTGPAAVLGGECGFFNLYVRRPVDVDLLHEGLGEVFHGEEATLFKLYPSCGLTLCMTDVALGLSRAHDVQPARIAHIDLTMSKGASMVCGQAFQPSRETPDVDAAFSAQYVVASAILRGRSTLREFSAEAVFDPEVLDLASKVRIRVDETFGYDRCHLRLTSPDGTVLEAEDEYGRGWPQNPATADDMTQKFKACLEYAAPAFSELQAEAIIASVDGLAHAEFVSDLVSRCVHPDL